MDTRASAPPPIRVRRRLLSSRPRRLTNRSLPCSARRERQHGVVGVRRDGDVPGQVDVGGEVFQEFPEVHVGGREVDFPQAQPVTQRRAVLALASFLLMPVMEVEALEAVDSESVAARACRASPRRWPSASSVRSSRAIVW